MKMDNIEQIDYLRDKAGLSYEEAVGLLERFDGDLTKCMVELERMGRIRPEDSADRRGYQGEPHKRRGPAFVLDWEAVRRVLFSRVSVRKGDTIVTNLTVLAWIFVFLAAPWVVVVGVIATFLTGCKVKWNKGAADAKLDFHTFVGQAADNIRRTADSVADVVKSNTSPVGSEEQSGTEGGQQ